MEHLQEVLLHGIAANLVGPWMNLSNPWEKRYDRNIASLNNTVLHHVLKWVMLGQYWEPWVGLMAGHPASPNRHMALCAGIM
jgi:hypothetical protein